MGCARVSDGLRRTSARPQGCEEEAAVIRVYGVVDEEGVLVLDKARGVGAAINWGGLVMVGVRSASPIDGAAKVSLHLSELSSLRPVGYGRDSPQSEDCCP